MFSCIQEVLDVKQRLHQIEMEMSKLRSRQVKMEKDGKPNLLLNSGKSISSKCSNFLNHWIYLLFYSFSVFF